MLMVYCQTLALAFCGFAVRHSNLLITKSISSPYIEVKY